jgi:2,3-bisphosphoglycerate-dependent phosphoglycerate mutase
VSRIFLSRHGETVWHEGNRYAGRSDVALTEKGLAQAEQLGHWAAQAELTDVWSSTLSRARITAEPAGRLTGLGVRTDERLVELDFGQGEGLTDAEMKQQFPEARAAFFADPVTHHLPGGEDPAVGVERGVAALFDIAAAAGPDGRILVVAHNTLCRLMLCRILDIPLQRYRRVFPSFKNCSLTELRFTPSGIALLSFNLPLPK